MKKQKQSSNKLGNKDGSRFRVVVANTVMALTALLAALVLLLVSMGYKFGLDGKLGRTGLVQISSLPSGADVEVDGKKSQLMRTEFSQSFDAGWHSFVVSKSGYDTWRKTVDVKPGVVTRLSYVRLFPIDRKTETVRTEEDIYKVYTATGRQTIFLMKSVSEWELVDIRGDRTKVTDVDVAELFSEGMLEMAQDVAVTAWSEDGQRALVRVTMESGKYEWVVIDATQLSKSVNLNKALSFDFSDVVFADKTGSKVFVLERGNLRQADVSAKTVTGAIQRNVTHISGLVGRVMYVRADEETDKRLIEVWREGSDGVTSVGEIDADAGDDIALVQAEFQGKSWIAYRVGGLVRVFDGQLDSVGKDETVSMIVERKFDDCEGGFSVGGWGQFIKLRCDGKTGTIDLENEDEYYIVDKTEAVARWLDDHMYYLQDGEDTYAIDFDGENGRWILPSSEFSVVISTDNRWMYYFDTNDEGEHELLRQRLEV